MILIDMLYSFHDDETGQDVAIAEELSNLISNLNKSKEEGEIPEKEIRECELIVVSIMSSPGDAQADAAASKKRKSVVLTTGTTENGSINSSGIKMPESEEKSDEEYQESKLPKKKLKLSETASAPGSVDNALASSQTSDVSEGDAPRRSGRTPKKKKHHDAIDDEDEALLDDNDPMAVSRVPEIEPAVVKPPKPQPRKALVSSNEVRPMLSPIALRGLNNVNLHGFQFFVSSSRIYAAFQDLAVFVWNLGAAVMQSVPLRASDKAPSKGILNSDVAIFWRKGISSHPRQAAPILGSSWWLNDCLQLNYVPASRHTQGQLIDFRPSQSMNRIAFAALSEANFSAAASVTSAVAAGNHLLLSNPLASDSNSTVSHVVRLYQSAPHLFCLASSSHSAPQKLPLPLIPVKRMRTVGFAELIDISTVQNLDRLRRTPVSVPNVIDAPAPLPPSLFNQSSFATSPAVPVPLIVPSANDAPGRQTNITSTRTLDLATLIWPFFEEETILFSSRESDSLKPILSDLKAALVSERLDVSGLQVCRAALSKLQALQGANDVKAFPSAKSSVQRRKELFAYLWQELRQLALHVKGSSENHKLLFEEISKMLPSDNQKPVAPSASSAPDHHPGSERQLDQLVQESRSVNNSDLVFKEDISWGKSRRKFTFPAPSPNAILSADPRTLYSLVRHISWFIINRFDRHSV
jgi:hypothetical protein